MKNELQMKKGLLQKQSHLFTENEKIVDKVSEFDKTKAENISYMELQMLI